MPALSKGTPIGIKAVDYTPICVGDQLTDPNSKLTLIVDKFGKLKDNFDVVHEKKDGYYSIFCKTLPAGPRPAKPEKPKEEPRQTLENATDSEIIEALKAKGWTGTITKVVTFEL